MYIVCRKSERTLAALTDTKVATCRPVQAEIYSTDRDGHHFLDPHTGREEIFSLLFRVGPGRVSMATGLHGDGGRDAW